MALCSCQTPLLCVCVRVCVRACVCVCCVDTTQADSFLLSSPIQPYPLSPTYELSSPLSPIHTFHVLFQSPSQMFSVTSSGHSSSPPTAPSGPQVQCWWKWGSVGWREVQPAHCFGASGGRRKFKHVME